MEKKLKTVDIIRPGSINAIIGPVGTLKRILNNQDYFNNRGYQVSVFASESINNGPIKVPPVAVKQIDSAKSRVRKIIGSFLRMRAKSNRWIARWLLVKDAKRYSALIDYYISLNRTPDIVQFHSNYECYLYLKRRKEHSAKVVMFMHSDGIPYEMLLHYYPCLKGSSYIKTMEKDFVWTVENTDRINFIAKIGQKNFLQLFPNRSVNDTSVIINGIDDLTEQQRIEVDIIRKESEKSIYKYRMCCTGTINTRKGHRFIIDALHMLPKALLSQIHVDFMGEGGERPILENLVKRYGLEKHVTFYGLVPNTEVYKYLAQNNIYILMSKNEGLPISIIEAMRAGLPVISTKVSGIPELVRDDYNGFLLNPNCEELVGLLQKLPLYNWGKMGENSRHRFEAEFTFERMRKEFCDMYDDVLI